MRKVVEGFMFTTAGGEHADRDETVCQIIGRVESESNLENGPTFKVKFSDGFEAAAFSSELRPWFPT